MRTMKLNRSRAISSLVSLFLIVSFLQIIPVALPNIAAPKANAAVTCPTVDGQVGVATGTNPVTCTYTNLVSNASGSGGINQGTYLTVTLVGAAGGGGGADNSVSGMAGGAGATVSNYGFITASGTLKFCIGTGGSGGKAQDNGAGGGAGGSNPCSTNFNGGTGGGAGNYGNSGAGGGGGARRRSADGSRKTRPRSASHTRFLVRRHTRPATANGNRESSCRSVRAGSRSRRGRSA